MFIAHVGPDKALHSVQRYPNQSLGEVLRDEESELQGDHWGLPQVPVTAGDSPEVPSTGRGT